MVEIPAEAFHAAERAVRDGVSVRLGKNALALAQRGELVLLSGTEAEAAAHLALEAGGPIVAEHALRTATRQQHEEMIGRIATEAIERERPKLLAMVEQTADQAMAGKAAAIAAQARADERAAIAERARRGDLPADSSESLAIALYRRQGRQDAAGQIADLILDVVGGRNPDHGVARPVNEQGMPVTDAEWAALIARTAFPKGHDHV